MEEGKQPEQHFENEEGEETLELDGLDQNDVEDFMELENGGEQEEQGDEEQFRNNNEIIFEDDSIQGFFDHKEPVFSLAAHPKFSHLIASGGGDDKAYLWDINTGETLFKFEGHTDSVISLEFNFDGQYLASGGMDGIIQIFNMESGKLACRLEGPDEVTFLKWHPKGNVLLAGGQDGMLWMYQAPSGKVMNVFAGNTSGLTCGAFSHNGKRIITGSEDGTLILFDPVTTEALWRLTPEDGRFHQETITCLSIHPDDQLLLTGSSDNSARLINLNNGEIVGALANHTESIEAVDFCDVLPLVATGSVDGLTNLWDISTMRLRHTLKHEEAVTKLQFLPNTPLVITSSMDQTVKVWDVRTAQNLKTFKGHQDTVLTFTVAGDGKKVVTGSDDGCALVFGLEG